MGTMKICPRCGEEYVLTASTCADCGVPLGFEGPAAGEPAAALELPPTSELVPLRHAEVSWIEGLAAALAEAGIPSRVELPDEADLRGRVQRAGTGAIRCTLYVRPEDAPAAARVDAEFTRTQVPDLPEDATSAWSEAETCPGCGTPLAPDAGECPECGLAFGSEE
jgi:ribosomal protein L40E